MIAELHNKEFTVAQKVTMPNDVIDQLLRGVHDIANHTQPEWYRPITDWGLAVGTLALAAFTALLFRATASLAKSTAQLAADTVGASTLADIHHQESQAPLVIWDGDRLIEFENPQSPDCRIIMHGYLRNVGFGPALNVDVQVFFEEGEPIKIPAGAFAVGDRAPERETRPGYSAPNIYDERSNLRVPTLVQITYSTLYGRTRYATYPTAGTSDARRLSYRFRPEIIELNRDERISALVLAAQSP